MNERQEHESEELVQRSIDILRLYRRSEIQLQEVADPLLEQLLVLHAVQANDCLDLVSPVMKVIELIETLVVKAHLGVRFLMGLIRNGQFLCCH